MNIFVDIDQTISTGYVGGSLEESMAYYRGRGIVLPPLVGSYAQLFQLPEVAGIHEPLLGAQEGVRQLTCLGTVTYATARKPDVEDITRAWLASQGFPSPEQVIFCQGVAEKLLAIAAYPGPLVLVDDRWSQLLDIVGQYRERQKVLRGLAGRLTLVAFGAEASALPGVVGVPVLPLPDWGCLTEVFLSECARVVHSKRERIGYDSSHGNFG